MPVVPEEVVTSALVAVAAPGHQAMYQPLSTVARTDVPSLRSNVTAVTPAPVRPSASVSWSPAESRVTPPENWSCPAATVTGCVLVLLDDMKMLLPLRQTAVVSDWA